MTRATANAANDVNDANDANAANDANVTNDALQDIKHFMIHLSTF